MRRAPGFKHLQIEHTVHPHLHVVARDADLRRDVDRLFLQRVAIADDIDERDEDVEAGLQHAGKSSETLDDERVLLRHHHRRLRHDDEQEEGEDHDGDQCA